MYGCYDTYSLADSLKKYPAGKIVAVALNKDNTACSWRETPFRILPVTKIIQTDDCVYLEYSEASFCEHLINVHEVLSAVEVTGFGDIAAFGREFKRGVLGLFGKHIPDRQHRRVQVMLRGTKISDFQQIFDICDIQIHQNLVCLFE